MSLLFSCPGVDRYITRQRNRFYLKSFGAAIPSQTVAGELLFILYSCNTLDNTEETMVLVAMNWGHSVLKDIMGDGMHPL